MAFPSFQAVPETACEDRFLKSLPYSSPMCSVSLVHSLWKSLTVFYGALTSGFYADVQHFAFSLTVRGHLCQSCVTKPFDRDRKTTIEIGRPGPA